MGAITIVALLTFTFLLPSFAQEGTQEEYIIQYLRQLSGFELNGYVMNTEGCNPQKPYESSFELNEYVLNTTH